MIWINLEVNFTRYQTIKSVGRNCSEFCHFWLALLWEGSSTTSVRPVRAGISVSTTLKMWFCSICKIKPFLSRPCNHSISVFFFLLALRVHRFKWHWKCFPCSNRSTNILVALILPRFHIYISFYFKIIEIIHMFKYNITNVKNYVVDYLRKWY